MLESIKALISAIELMMVVHDVSLCVLKLMCAGFHTTPHFDVQLGSYMPTVLVSLGQSRDLGFCPGSKGNSENVLGFLMHFVWGSCICMVCSVCVCMHAELTLSLYF